MSKSKQSETPAAKHATILRHPGSDLFAWEGVNAEGVQVETASSLTWPEVSAQVSKFLGRYDADDAPIVNEADASVQDPGADA